jgi:hypothetical protein
MLFERMKAKHGHTPKWEEKWSAGSISKSDLEFLRAHEIRPPSSGA